MRYLIALLFPPLAILLCGKLVQFLISLALVVFAFATMGATYVIAIIHALFVVHAHLADRRHRELVAAIARK